MALEWRGTAGNGVERRGGCPALGCQTRDSARRKNGGAGAQLARAIRRGMPMQRLRLISCYNTYVCFNEYEY